MSQEHKVHKFIRGVTFWNPNLETDPLLGVEVQESISIVSTTTVAPGDKRLGYIIETDNPSIFSEGTKTKGVTQSLLMKMVAGWETAPGRSIGKTRSYSLDPKSVFEGLKYWRRR